MKATAPKVSKSKSVSKAKKATPLADMPMTTAMPMPPPAPSPASCTSITFYTMPGCGPCELVKGLMKKDPESAKRFDIVSLGTAKGTKQIDDADIQSFPTFVRADGAKKVGAHKLADLIAWADKSK